MLLVEPSGRVREHGVDLARLRGQVGARHHLAAVVARDLLEQPLELADVAVDRAHEVALATILAANLLERLLPLHGVQLVREHVAVPTVVALPQLGRRLVIDHAGDVDGERVERVDAAAHGAGRLTPGSRPRSRPRRWSRPWSWPWRWSRPRTACDRHLLGLLRG